MYKYVIFDLDGTLIDTLDDLKKGINFALKELGYNISYTKEETKYLIGEGTRNLCARAIKNIPHTEEDEEILFKEFSRLYKLHQLDDTRPFVHVEELLKLLKENNIKAAVLSNKVEQNVIDILSHLKLDSYFEIIRGQRKDIPLKPNPSSLNNLISDLGASKEEVLYVGDSDVDMIVSHNAEVNVAAVTYGYRDIELLKKYNPNYIISDPLEIYNIVK